MTASPIRPRDIFSTWFITSKISHCRSHKSNMRNENKKHSHLLYHQWNQILLNSMGSFQSWAHDTSKDSILEDNCPALESPKTSIRKTKLLLNSYLRRKITNNDPLCIQKNTNMLSGAFHFIRLGLSYKWDNFSLTQMLKFPLIQGFLLNTLSLSTN